MASATDSGASTTVSLSAHELRVPVAAFRGALLVLCGVLSILATSRTYAALPIALLGCLVIAAERVTAARRHPVALGLVETVVAALSVIGTGGSLSPMLPYLLAPPVCVGLVVGARAVGAVTVLAAGTLLAGRIIPTPWLGSRDLLRSFLQSGGQFVALGFALGVVAARARMLTQGEDALDEDRFVEARGLLRDLRAISRRLPGGLDASSTGEVLLGRCAEVVATVRSAVLVQPAAAALVPIAVRGTRRVPWRAPLTEPGPLRTAWETRAPLVDRREADADGRRRGSAIAVLPLLAEQGPFGLVVLESFELDAFPPAVLTALEAHVRASALRLETALLFDEVRSAVTVEERDRLAREMHDGVAQELAYLGYQLDDLRFQAGKVDQALASRVGELRNDLTGLISNLRLAITDLKTSVGTERGLGSALSSYVRAVGSGQQLTVHLSLEESAFRLPGDQEVLLLQIAQAVTQDVRRSRTAANLWVSLSVAPPYARLLVEHDGDSPPDEELLLFRQQLVASGGTLSVRPRNAGGVSVEVVLEGGSDVVDSDVGRRPRPDPPGPAAGL